MSRFSIRIRTALFAAACLGAGPAIAHITLETPQAPVAHSYKAVLRVPHGCHGSATTALRVQIPEGVIGVKPQPKAGWTIERKEGKYRHAHTLYGSEVTSGVTEIAWRGGPLPDDDYDEFVFFAYLSGDLTPGTALLLPIVQECEDGVTRWIDEPGAGRADHSDTPAPALRLLPAQK